MKQKSTNYSGLKLGVNIGGRTNACTHNFETARNCDCEKPETLEWRKRESVGNGQTQVILLFFLEKSDFSKT